MRFRDDQKGFTIVELVIVTAIVTIMASLSLTMLGRIKYANTEKMVNYVYDALKKLQITAMSKSDPYYLHIYKEGDEYYYITSTSSTYLSSMGTNGTSLGGNIKIFKVVGAGGTEEEIVGNKRIAISYRKDGRIREKDASGSALEDIRKIVIKGSFDVEIRINHETGKCVAEKR
ncbi:MAG: prepilin-type N-terminal cleavage/methylation domain-containing protein [Lachnospiraceae bacterium]|nr:prepilin-type N-terminal cleavage/methylation domain-containing protein [Lachnospiraceae bacterium]